MPAPNAADPCPGCFLDAGGRRPCPHCGFDERAPRPALLLPLGARVGKFVIGRVLGKPGGFGITYLAWHETLHRRVAIKEYLPREWAGRAPDRISVEPHGDEEAALFAEHRQRFLDEARTLAQLKHPGIVQVFDVDEANGTAYLVMEYYPGLTLADHVARRGGRLPEAEALALFAPVLDGLAAVHAQDLLHRDLKPDNIYLAALPNGGVRPLLIDFGTARRVNGGRSTVQSAMFESVGFSAPELGFPKTRLDARTDLYALAATLYCCLTGEVPPGANARTAGAPLVPASAFGISAPVSAAIEQCLAFRMDQRPADVAALRVLLYGERAPVPAPPGPSPRPPPRHPDPEPERTRPEPPRPPAPERASDHPPPAPKPRWLVPVLVLLLMLATGAGGYAWWQSAEAQRMAAEAAERAEAARRQAEQERVAREAQVQRQREADAARREAEQQEQARQAALAAEAKRQAQEAERRRQAAQRQPFEPELVAIPAGSFLMGSPASEADRNDNEGPQHRVQVPAFELCKTEVTFAQWDACAADGGCTHKPDDEGWGRGNRPVINVSWDDAQEYLQWLSRKTGRTWRLPSEAEWEYAARAGTNTPFSTGNCISTAQANYNGDYPYQNCAKSGLYLAKTQPVGSYPVNPWGLHDMHGNVWEWVADNWHDNYNGAPTDGSAWQAAVGDSRVVRGGAFINEARSLRAAFRNRNRPENRYESRGFRCARAPAASIDR